MSDRRRRRTVVVAVALLAVLPQCCCCVIPLGGPRMVVPVQRVTPRTAAGASLGHVARGVLAEARGR